MMRLSKGLLVLMIALSGILAPEVRAEDAADRAKIEQVFDRNKGGFYAIYSRALRENPELQGKVSFEFIIDRSGSVSSCRILSSDLHAPDVERKMCERVKLMKFEPRPQPRTIVKFVDFFPA